MLKSDRRRGRCAIFCSLTLVLTAPHTHAAPTVLQPGDVSIIGYQGRTQDFTIKSSAGDDILMTTGRAFTFVTWVDLEKDTQIGLTDFGYQGGGSWYSGTGEGAAVWTATDAVTAGTVVRLFFADHQSFPDDTVREANIGSVEGITGNFSYLASIGGDIYNQGDQVFAYQGAFTVDSESRTATLDGTPLFGLNTDHQTPTSWYPLDENDPDEGFKDNKSKLPQPLADAGAHVEIIDLGDEGDDPLIRRNAQFNRDSLDGLPLTLAEYQAAINDPSNWTFDDGWPATDWLDDTGFEIAAHVPEPGVALTLTLGLAGFTLPMRRRDRDRAASEKP